MSKLLLKRILYIASIVACLLATATATACMAQDNSNDDLERATVVRVVDGDTIEIDRGNEPERLRLIGIDAPESKHPDDDLNSEEGARAAAYLEAALPAGTTVWLESDVSDLDRYGRLLRYVWTAPPDNRRANVPDKMLNAQIVAAGYAKAKRYPPDTRYAEELESQQEIAVAKGAGVSYLWANE